MVAVTALDVVLDAMIVLILFTEPAAGVKPVNDVVPLYVHEVVAVAAEEGIT